MHQGSFTMLQKYFLLLSVLIRYICCICSIFMFLGHTFQLFLFYNQSKYVAYLGIFYCFAIFQCCDDLGCLVWDHGLRAGFIC
jgi:glycerol-3-phosphate acyltransferase PlsY